MRFLETSLFYLLLGAGVALAVGLSSKPLRFSQQLFRLITAFFFWPLYLPSLLSRLPPEDGAQDRSADEPDDAIARTIAQVEGELASALSSLGGWAEGVLAREKPRLEELQRAWRVQAARIREMERLLLEEQKPKGAAADGHLVDQGEHLRRFEEARLQNVARLEEVRRRALEDLMGTLAWVRELVSMIHLAKFTGAPPSRAEELVAQIAASVEGLSEVTAWKS